MRKEAPINRSVIPRPGGWGLVFETPAREPLDPGVSKTRLQPLPGITGVFDRAKNTPILGKRGPAASVNRWLDGFSRPCLCRDPTGLPPRARW